MKQGSHQRESRKIVKVILVGDAAVGKTSLCRKYTDEKFKDSYLATLGVDFSTKLIRLNDMTVEIQLWDIAGQKNYDKLQRKFLKTSHGALLVYDVTNEESFVNLINRLNIIMEMNQEKAPEFLIVGNKIDLKTPERDPEEIQEYFVNMGLNYQNPLESMKTSAKTGENVENLFRRIATKIIDAEKHQTNQIS